MTESDGKKNQHWMIRRMKESAHMLGDDDVASSPSIEMNSI